MPEPIVLVPAAPLISAADAKARVPSLSTVDDGIWDAHLATATEMAEMRTGRALGVQTLRWALDWPHDFAWFGAGRALVTLPRPPFRSIAADGITYLDYDGVSQTFDAAKWVAIGTGGPGRIVLRQGASWPVVGCYPEAMTFVFSAGYDDVPAPILSWIIATAADGVSQAQSATGEIRSVQAEGVGTVTYATSATSQTYVGKALDDALSLYRVF